MGARHLLSSSLPLGSTATFAAVPGHVADPISSIETGALPALARHYPSRLCLDHSRFPVLVAATLAALPSTRAIETRSLPTSLAATRRGFTFYVAFPQRSIASLATC